MLGKSDAAKGYLRVEAATYFKFDIDHSDQFIRHFKGQVYSPCYYRGLASLVPFYEKYHEETQPENLPSLISTIRQRVSFLCAGLVVVEEPSYHRPVSNISTELQEISFAAPRRFYSIAKRSSSKATASLLMRYQRHRHISCVYKLNVPESHQMICWLRDMTVSTDVGNVKFLQHVNEAMSRVYATRNGGFNENWVYDQAKLDLDNHQVLDFVTPAFQVGSTELFSHSLSINRSLSHRYNDYPLLCTSDHDISLAWRQKFPGLRADPNATFYWWLQDWLKTSLWF
jgi:hypothetical protein